MLDLIGAIVGMMAITIDVVAIAAALQLSLARRLVLGAIAGAWVGLATGLAAAGALAFSPDQPVPLIGVLFAVPLLVAALFWVGSARFREALTPIPMPLLIGLNTLRVLGVLFLALAAAGRLSGPFPYSAGWGDIITGALAIPVARLAMRGSSRAGLAVAAWNAFGALDLIAAVTLGITSAQGSPLQLIHAGIGSDAMQHLPYSLVPTVLVPFYLITHATVAAQLARGGLRRGRRPGLLDAGHPGPTNEAYG
ncbi:MAG TPA: hypothetical protein VNW46_04585 [Gemmatimonadaceae bacterium]|nr:hypothetical protein [Gemmatimonadaceae bacterium]